MPPTPKWNRLPDLESHYFSHRGTRVKWPTLRKAWLTPQAIKRIRSIAFGVIFLEGPYNTRLNYGNVGPHTLENGQETAIFFEHLHKVQDQHIFLLCWVGNFHNGCIFHCAWQFPQMKAWDWQALEVAAYETYKIIANIVYDRKITDKEVQEFLKKGDSRES